jgi:hypothetical protein
MTEIFWFLVGMAAGLVVAAIILESRSYAGMGKCPTCGR